MAWSKRTNADGSVAWRCSSYSDLNYAQINNFAEYGQPFSPYGEKGFDHDLDPDFSKIVIEMPHLEVMNNGFGLGLNLRSFRVVQRFLKEPEPLPMEHGSHTFNDLVHCRFASEQDRFYSTTLYTSPAKGDIDPFGAAYIYGSVGFALMKGTRFSNAPMSRDVIAEVGVLDDNWDFESNSIIARMLNPWVAATFGPDHYNLEGPIRIRFFGPGRIFRETEEVSSDNPIIYY